MKKLITLVLSIILLITFTSCGDTYNYNGVEYETFGIVNKSQVRDPNVEYDVIIGNVIWSVILFETVVFPIYFFGFSIYEPVGMKNSVQLQPHNQ